MAKIITLPETLNSEAFEELKHSLQEEISTDGELEIDANSVSRLTTPCTQLLVSFLQNRKNRQQEIKIKNASEAFQLAWNDMGLSSQFTLGA